MNNFIRRRCLKPQSATSLPESAFLNLVSYKPYRDSGTVFSCRFNTDHRFTNIFAFTKENGEVCFGDTRLATYKENNQGTRSSSDIIVEALQADRNAIFDCEWQPSYYDHLLLASGDGSVSLWSVDNRAKITTFRGHTLSIRRLSVCSDEPHLFATGGRDGCVRVWDVRMPSKDEDGVAPVRTICHAHSVSGQKSRQQKLTNVRRSVSGKGGFQRDDAANSVTAVLLQDKHTVISGSDRISDIRFWDLRKTYSQQPRSPPTPARSFPPPAESKLDAGFTCFVTEPWTRHTLYASRRDNVVYAYSLTTSSNKPIQRYLGASISSYYVPATVCPTSPYLLCGSRDGCAMIWQVDSSQPAYVLNGHLEEVCAVAWNDRFELLTFAGDSWRLWKHDGRPAAEFPYSPNIARCQLYKEDIIDEVPRKRARFTCMKNENSVPKR